MLSQANMVHFVVSLPFNTVSPGFAVLLVALVVVLRDKSSPGFTGAARVSLMIISPLLNEVVDYWAHFSISIASVSRVRKFTLGTPVEDTMQFCDVSAAYGKRTVLNRVSVLIRAGEEIGICGQSAVDKAH